MFCSSRAHCCGVFSFNGDGRDREFDMDVIVVVGFLDLHYFVARKVQDVRWHWLMPHLKNLSLDNPINLRFPLWGLMR